MSYENPYSPPQAEVSDPQNDVAGELLDSPRSNSIGYGWSWIAEGFALFKAAPGIWIANLILLIVILVVLMFIPVVGSLAQTLLSTVFTGGLMLGCYALDRGDALEVEHLFAGFKHRFGALLGVGAVSMFGTVAIFITAFLLSGVDLSVLAGLESGELTPEQMDQLGPGFAIAILVAVGLLIPLMMALWFAPALLVRHEEVGLFQAMKLSFVGCLKNILPFLWYGIVLGVLGIIATVPLALGWLVLGPMIYASMYAGYKDIFLE